MPQQLGKGQSHKFAFKVEIIKVDKGLSQSEPEKNND